MRLAPDGLSVLGEPTKTYEGWDYRGEWVTEFSCPESPKLLHHEGFYYLTSAQGGTAGPGNRWYIVYHRYEDGYRTMGRQPLIEPIEWTGDGQYDISFPDGQAF